MSFRVKALRQLQETIGSHEKELMAALKADLNKSKFDAYPTEIGVVLEEIRFALKNLPKWVRLQKVKTPITHLGSKGYI